MQAGVGKGVTGAESGSGPATALRPGEQRLEEGERFVGECGHGGHALRGSWQRSGGAALCEKGGVFAQPGEAEFEGAALIDGGLVVVSPIARDARLFDEDPVFEEARVDTSAEEEP